MQSGKIALKCIRRLFTALEQLNAVIDGGRAGATPGFVSAQPDGKSWSRVEPYFLS